MLFVKTIILKAFFYIEIHIYVHLKYKKILKILY